MKNWARPEPSERIDQILYEVISEGPPKGKPGVWLAHYEAIKRFLDEYTERQTEQRRPDAQV